MQDKLARLSAMPIVRGRASLLLPRNTERESEWPWSLEPEQENSVPSFPMDSSNRRHMLKGISQWQLFYRFPILKKKERETIRHQLERLWGEGGGCPRSWGLSCSKGQHKTLLVGRGHGISLLRSAGSFSKLINTIYKLGGEARETEWLSSGDAGYVCSVCVEKGILQATQWAGWPGGEEPDAFRNCTCGLKMWWESCLPGQASNAGSRNRERGWNGIEALSVGTGPHWSPGEQGRSADGASPLPGVLVAYLWPESGVSIEHKSCKSSSMGSHLTGKDHAVSS